MQAEWKQAILRFVLNNLGQMDQDDLDEWLEGTFDIAPLLEPPLRAQAQHRDQIMRELHQITAAEVFDRFQSEHKELVFKDRQNAVLRIGKELENLKAIVISL